MKIVFGSDRRGFAYKKELIEYAKTKGHEVLDCGPYDDNDPVDYPIYGEMVGKKVADKECDFGVVICATGIGIMISANKVKGVRCGMAYNDDVARFMREHNDANVIAFGQGHMNIDDVKKRFDIFLGAKFLDGYHATRIKQISDIENGIPIKQTPYMNK